jgi:hypothetical protein
MCQETKVRKINYVKGIIKVSEDPPNCPKDLMHIGAAAEKYQISESWIRQHCKQLYKIERKVYVSESIVKTKVKEYRTPKML